MRYALAGLLFSIACTALGGCGQTGPLYMPPAEEAAQGKPKQPVDAAGQAAEES